MDAGNPLNLFKTHRSGRQPRLSQRNTKRCTWMSLEKEQGWILCKMAGLQYPINCPEIKWGQFTHEDQGCPANWRGEATPSSASRQDVGRRRIRRR